MANAYYFGIIVFFALVALLKTKETLAEKYSVYFDSISDCKGSKDAALDFSKLKVSKDKKYIEGMVEVKKDVSETKLTVKRYETIDGKREKKMDKKLDYCTDVSKPPSFPSIEILKQGAGDKCPIKKGKRKVKVSMPKKKLKDGRVVETVVLFPDKSCYKLFLKAQKG